ncbi:hypothetical protein HPB51_016555 [Rhipicephalus microplus]|uniref:Secreted protein n=1 Tax=Rhipicephalus microplus TaxID=6941 RepID=A0A9J6EA13_RHIMP|nr:hypothetical protein HPB51_016555 [Rhipicephalus microplus]
MQATLLWLPLRLVLPQPPPPPQRRSVILAAADGEIVADPDVQRSALNVVINCVCGPMSRLGGGIGRVVSGSVRKRAAIKSGEDLLSKMWNCVRANNGIMVRACHICRINDGTGLHN